MTRPGFAISSQGFGSQYPWGFHGALSIALSPQYAPTAQIDAETAPSLIVVNQVTTFTLALDPLKQSNNTSGDPAFSDPPKSITWIFEDGTAVSTPDVSAEATPSNFTSPTRTYTALGVFEALLKVTTVAGRDHIARFYGRVLSA